MKLFVSLQDGAVGETVNWMIELGGLWFDVKIARATIDSPPEI